jgi:hypothetical protein
LGMARRLMAGPRPMDAVHGRVVHGGRLRFGAPGAQCARRTVGRMPERAAGCNATAGLTGILAAAGFQSGGWTGSAPRVSAGDGGHTGGHLVGR